MSFVAEEARGPPNRDGELARCARAPCVGFTSWTSFTGPNTGSAPFAVAGSATDRPGVLGPLGLAMHVELKLRATDQVPTR